MSTISRLLFPLVLTALLGACGGDAAAPDRPVPSGPVEVVPGSFPVRLIPEESDEGTPPLLEDQLDDLAPWQVLDLTSGELAPADGHAAVARVEQGVRLVKPDTALVRFVGLPSDLAVSVVARLDTGSFDGSEVCDALHLVFMDFLGEGETAEAAMGDGEVVLPSGQSVSLERRLSVVLAKGALNDRSTWIAPPDKDGFARGRARTPAMTKGDHVRAVVLINAGEELGVGGIRVEPKPELEKHHKRGHAATELSNDDLAGGGLALAMKVSGERRLTFAVPAWGEHDLTAEVPAGARWFSFGLCQRPGGGPGARSAWWVELAGGDGAVTELGHGSLVADPGAAHFFEPVQLDWPAHWQGPANATVRFRVRGDEAVLFGAPTVRAPAVDDRPNLLFVSIDTLRADHLSGYGYERPTSPMLDAFAEGAVTFESMSGVAPFTLPTHATMLTGLQPLRHGTIDGGADRLPADQLPYLPRLLSEAGWNTAAFTGGGFLSADYGFATGFDRFIAVDPVINVDSPSARHRYENDTPPHAREIEEAASIHRVADWIESRGDERWFAFVHTFATHDYQPPEDDFALFDTRPDDTWGEDFAELQAYLSPKGWIDDPPDQARIDRLRDLYDATIRFTDRQLGTFLQTLEDRGLMDDTVVVITSDHGEEFGEHGGLRHSFSLYEEMLHVPLIVAAPCVEGGRRVRESVTQADLTPTLLELLGVPVEDVDFDGRSLAGLLCRNERDLEKPRNMGHVDTLLSDRISVRSGPYKLIRGETDGERVRHPAAETWELYDLSQDPDETTNLVTDSPSRFQSLQEELAGLETLLKAGAVVGGESELSPELLQQLEELGYVGG